MIETLTERQESYKKPFDYQITKRMPIIITVNGRSFKRLTKNKFYIPNYYNYEKY